MTTTTTTTTTTMMMMMIIIIIIIYTVSQKQQRSHNFGEGGPILIICLLLHSEMNCRKRRNRICHLAPNMLPHYLAKNLNVQLCSYMSARIIYT